MVVNNQIKNGLLLSLSVKKIEIIVLGHQHNTLSPTTVEPMRYSELFVKSRKLLTTVQCCLQDETFYSFDRTATYEDVRRYKRTHGETPQVGSDEPF